MALGTVQFGSPYGINNSSGIPDDHELRAILDLAVDSGIKLLDSAPSYGDAEMRIGDQASGRFDIVTKFSNVADQECLKGLLQQSLDHLKIENIYGYIAHNADELYAKPVIWDWLISEKKDGRVQKIGFSLYQPAQLENLLNMGMTPDLVQLPYNLLDRKFEGHLCRLKEIGTEIHVRSVFLQGLFFIDPERMKPKLKPLIPSLAALQEICHHNNISISELALGFVNNNSFIDKIVVGVENSEQLRKNLNDLNCDKVDTVIMNKVSAINVEAKNLLNPANW